ncbi:GRF-type domain-containing protein [Abeliophyllum distichum]|uniref:GRF-type domain-containing protein n=1 Tax=Abeliophyllum distichum TaxID=126358 RepID=A0ABD1T0X3_9LAMI
MDNNICRCGLPLELKTPWTYLNPSRLFLACQQRWKVSGCGLFVCCDPSTCPRCKDTMPELLNSNNRLQEENMFLKSKNKEFPWKIWFMGFICGIVVMWTKG